MNARSPRPACHAAPGRDDRRRTLLDGGGANPALFPLVRSGTADLLVVALSPMDHGSVPVTAETSEPARSSSASTPASCARPRCWPNERRARARLRLRAVERWLRACAPTSSTRTTTWAHCRPRRI